MQSNVETLAEDNIRILNLPKNHLSKPVAIILVGFPGAGKSTLVNSLAKTLPLAVVSDEAMAHFLFPYQATFLRHSQKEFLELAAKTIEKLLSRGVSCIYDSNVKFKEDRNILRQIIEGAGGLCLLVYLKIAKEEALQRVEKQNFEVSRGEKKGFIINKDLFQYEVSTTELPTSSEEYLVFDASNPESIYTLNQQILSKVNS